MIHYIIRILKLYPLIRGVQNICTWLPIIWRDRNFDESYMFTILIKKLQLMENFQRSDNAWGTDSEKIADQIQLARESLEYINTQQFNEDAFRNYYQVYPFDEVRWDQVLRGEPMESRSSNEKILYDLAIEDSEVLYNQAMDVFCNQLKENSRGWWD